MRIGTGYDAHKLVPDRPLFLGGVKVLHNKGLLGHSDGDCLIHAIIDALFGAAACGDIGTHFPPTDERYRGIYSIELLKEAVRIIESNGYKIENIDSTIIAQKPKLANYIPQMCEKIAKACGIEKDRISVKATTTETMGYEGREEGMSAMSVCLLESK